MTEKIYEALQRATTLLEEKGLDLGSPKILMESITKKNSATLLADLRESLTNEEHTTFWNGIKELLTGKPVQYITGIESFYGREFEVDEHVLIPRPETEELVFHAMERGRNLFLHKEIQIADIGTGSGAIAISFKKEWPEAVVTATDISPSALAVAERNAKKLGADITFFEGDIAEPIADQKWDIVLSNPPYIAHEEAEMMSDTVRSYEPHSALFADEEGLYFYRKLAESLPQLMNKPSLIGVEIGYLQGQAVAKLFKNTFPTAFVDILKDINGKDRMIFCKIDE